MARLLKNLFQRFMLEHSPRQLAHESPLRANPMPRMQALRERMVRDTETYLKSNLRREPSWRGRHPVQEQRRQQKFGSTIPGLRT